MGSKRYKMASNSLQEIACRTQRFWSCLLWVTLSLISDTEEWNGFLKKIANTTSPPKIKYVTDLLQNLYRKCMHHLSDEKKLLLKGTVSRDGFGFWWCVWLVLGLNRGRGPFFKYFSCSINFITQKVHFSRLMRIYVGLMMLSACTSFRFPCFLLVSRIWEILQRHLLYIRWSTVQILRQRMKKGTMQRQLLFLQHKQQANPLLSVHNFTPFLTGMTKISSQHY